MTDQPRWWGILGLARKAGKIVWGQESVKNAIKYNPKGLLIIAEDASPRIVGKMVKIAEGSGLTVVKISNKNFLGAAAGLSPVAFLLIEDSGFAQLFLNSL